MKNKFTSSICVSVSLLLLNNLENRVKSKGAKIKMGSLDNSNTLYTKLYSAVTMEVLKIPNRSQSIRANAESKITTANCGNDSFINSLYSLKSTLGFKFNCKFLLTK